MEGGISGFAGVVFYSLGYFVSFAPVFYEIFEIGAEEEFHILPGQQAGQVASEDPDFLLPQGLSEKEFVGAIAHFVQVDYLQVEAPVVFLQQDVFPVEIQVIDCVLVHLPR